MSIAAITFAQLAVLAYACPNGDTDGDVRAEAAADPCERADEAQSNLCFKHCHDSAQSPAQAPAACAHFVASFTVAIHIPDVAGGSDARTEPALLHATSPPATLRNCCLRI